LLLSEIAEAVFNFKFTFEKHFFGSLISEWMEFEVSPFLNTWHWRDIRMNSIDVGRKNLFIYAELERLFGSWEGRVQNVICSLIHELWISKHEDSMVIKKEETVFAISQVASSIIPIPHLMSIASVKLLIIAINSRISWEIFIFMP